MDTSRVRTRTHWVGSLVLALSLGIGVHLGGCAGTPSGGGGGGGGGDGDGNGNGDGDGGVSAVPTEVARVILEEELGYEGEEPPIAFAMADFDGDSFLDMAGVSNQSSGGDILITFNDGAGGFPLANRVEFGNVDGETSAVLVADMDGRNGLDLVIVNSGDSSVEPAFRQGGVIVALNQGDGTLVVGAQINTVVPHPKEVDVGDVNGDGALDVFVIDTRSTEGLADDLQILINDGGGSFSGSIEIVLPAEVGGFAPADVNADGDLDLLLSMVIENGQAINQMGVMLGNGTGAFGEVSRYESNPTPDTIRAADVNNDDDLDVIVGSGISDYSIYLGNGDGTFAPVRTLQSQTKSLIYVIRDVDGDGNLDIVGRGFGFPSIFFGDGEGGFPEAQALTFLEMTTMGLYDFVDVNNDALPDFVWTGMQVRDFGGDEGGVFVEVFTTLVQLQSEANAP